MPRLKNPSAAISWSHDTRFAVKVTSDGNRRNNPVRDRLPQELWTHRGAPLVEHRGVAKIRVHARRHALDAMDEEDQVHLRRPIDRIPWRRAWTETREHREEGVARQSRPRIEGDGTPPFENHVPRTNIRNT
jgi:hypothetical protein